MQELLQPTPIHASPSLHMTSKANSVYIRCLIQISSETVNDDDVSTNCFEQLQKIINPNCSLHLYSHRASLPAKYRYKYNE